ncbi:MAG: hypothetical protein Q4A62_02570 [Eikenella sp.]|nr:hypothetical protein [Eikenella sp.]
MAWCGITRSAGGERYILSFLGWSERFKETLNFTSRYTSLEKPRYRLNDNSSSQLTIQYKNYSYIDIEDKESYFLRYKIHPNLRVNNGKYLFHERMNKSQGMSNYAVYYKSIVKPEDRQYWIAGAEVSIIDQSNKQIMARKTWYAFAPNMRPMNNGSWAWHHAIHCPKDGEYGDPVVKFVISVVQPKQGE